MSAVSLPLRSQFYLGTEKMVKDHSGTATQNLPKTLRSDLISPWLPTISYTGDFDRRIDERFKSRLRVYAMTGLVRI